MTITYTIVDSLHQDRETVTGATEAEALKLVYETLVAWNHDHADCAKWLAEGCVPNDVSGARETGVTHLEFDPVGFWTRCASIMLTDNQEYFAGTVAPWEESGE